MDPATRWIHWAGLATYVASTVALVLVILPRARRVRDPAAQRTFLSRRLTPFNLLSVGALLVLLLSGGSAVTDLKAAMGREFTRLVWWLVLKLSLSFLLIFVATWLSFGLAHRVVRAERMADPVDPPWQSSILTRLGGVAWFGLALAAVTAWVGTWVRG